MGETICIINSKICPFNDGGFCIATKQQLFDVFDKDYCSYQGRY